MGERLDQQGTQLTAINYENSILQSRIQAIKPKAKATVKVKLNERFANFQDIIKKDAQREKVCDPFQRSYEIQQHSFEELCHEWQLD